MADRYWVGADAGATANWNTVNSWSTSTGGASGASVPGSSDTAIFDGGGSKVGGCVIDAAVDVAGINATSGYTGAGANDGHIDDATNNQSVTVSGDVTFDNKKVSMGSNTWMVSGNWDDKDLTTLTPGSSTLVLDGTSKNLTSKDAFARLGKVTVSGTYTTVNRCNFGGASSVSGTLTVSAETNVHFTTLTITGTVSINNGSGIALINGAINVSGGTLTGSGTANISASNGSAITGQTGTFSVPAVTTVQDFQIAAGTYGGAWTFAMTSGAGAATLKFNGNCVFTGNVEFKSAIAGTYTINVNNTNLTFQANCTFTETAGSVSWTKGTGTITFSGAADQTVNLLDKTVEDIVINKSTTAAKVTFTNGWTSDSFTLTQGTLAFDATGATLATTGNWTIGVNGQVDPTNLDGWTWDVGGNLSLSGESGDLLDLGASGAWYLEVDGAASATYVTAGYSDANGFTEIDADDGTNVDEGNNVNWAFTGAPSFNPSWYVQRRRQLSQAA